MMRFVRTMMAVLPVLAFAAQAHAQYGLYGAPSTLPLPSTQPVSQSATPQSPPLYADTSTATGVLVPGPVATSPAPQYANQAYANQPSAAQVHAGPRYGNSAYLPPAQAGYTPPGVLPRVQQIPYDPGYATPIVPTAATQAGQQATLPPPPVRAPSVAQPGMPHQNGTHIPGPISQMLTESENPYSGYGQSAGCETGACGGDPAACGDTCNPCEPCCPTWFGSVAALYMSRNEPNRLWTTYETNNNPNQLPTDARTGWEVGGEVTVGRYFCAEVCAPSCDPCGTSYRVPKWGIEATYWGLGGFDGYSSQSVAGGTVSTTLLVDGIEFGGVNGVSYFDGAGEHRVSRHNEIHNIEVNLFGSPNAGYGGGYGLAAAGVSHANAFQTSGGPMSVGWVMGARYFRFEENYLFGSLQDGRSWGEAGGIYEAYLEDNARNSLLGIQFGCDLSYDLRPNWRIFAAPKMGIYNNHVEHYFTARRGDGVVANPTVASGVTDTYPVNSSEDVVSFLSEIDLGVDWQVASNWSLYLGYRVIFATGIALADHQVPAYVVDIPEIAAVDTNGELVIHGAFAGVTVNY